MYLDSTSAQLPTRNYIFIIIIITTSELYDYYFTATDPVRAFGVTHYTI